MLPLIRTLIGIVLIAGLSQMVGCASASGSAAAKPGIFSWMTPKEPQKTTRVEDFIAHERPATITRR